ncbi:26354_t:CDS:2, partial [Racocetra persica]
MNELHHSNESARSPENNSTMYRVAACEPYQLKDEYIQLDDLLLEKSVYEHVEIQQYLPNNAIDRYRFMKEVQLIFPIGNLLAVNERRHGSILYIPLALSIRDLCETVVERLKNTYSDPLPSNINIPSDEWIRLQFCPANATTISEDAHYCAVLFKYLREFCIQYRQWTCLISADDKYKIPIGEDVAVSTGVRNQRTIVFQESTLAAADHDFSKLSLTPSVIFFISIPNDISGSFYDGQVFVSYKDIVFEPSTAIRHSAEFLKVLNIQYACQ